MTRLDQRESKQVPSLLVCGCLPRLPILNSKLPAQRERINALHAAKKEIATVRAEIRMRKELLSRVPRNTDLILEPGNKVRVYRETERKYIGSFP